MPVRVIAYFFTKSLNVNVNCSGIADIFIAPDLVEKLFSCKYLIIHRKNECQCDCICCMCMVDYSMFSVCDSLLHFMVHQMSWKRTCRSSTFYQPPTDSVFCSCIINLDNCKTYFRINDNISEILSTSCYKEEFSCKSRNFFSYSL